MVQNDSSILTDKLNYTKMSDCGRLAKKVKVLGDIVEKSLCNSIRAFKAYILSLLSSKTSAKLTKLKGEDTEYSCTLVELFSQNIKTDYRIYIMGHIDASNNSVDSAAKATETMSFCNAFKNIVGECLVQQEDKRTKGDTHSENVTNLENILGELKREEFEDCKKREESLCNPVPPQASPIQIRDAEEVSPLTPKATELIPDELVTKLSELAKVTNEAVEAGGEAGDKIDVSASKINAALSERDKEPEACFSGVFLNEEKDLLSNINENAQELNKNLMEMNPPPVTPPPVEKTEQYNKLLKVIKANQGQPHQIKKERSEQSSRYSRKEPSPKKQNPLLIFPKAPSAMAKAAKELKCEKVKLNENSATNEHKNVNLTSFIQV